MSVAWGGIVILVLLLPGVLFFVGIYIPEKFTRETTERSALGQLAGTVLIAFLVHGFLFSVLSHGCGRVYPCIDLDLVLRLVAFDSSSGESSAIAANITQFRWWIFLYVLLSSALGMLAGALTGGGIVKGWLRFLAQHTWIYDLTVEDYETLTLAYVMTKVGPNSRVLLYRGHHRRQRLPVVDGYP
jgi:hypothetical protein